MSSFFRSLAKAHDHRWGLEHRLTGKSTSIMTRSHALTYLSYLSLVNKTHWFLISSTWGSNSLPTRSGQSIVFKLRTMALDFEVVTLIPTAAHSVANSPRKHWRSQPDEAIRTTSSAKSSNKLPANCFRNAGFEQGPLGLHMSSLLSGWRNHSYRGGRWRHSAQEKKPERWCQVEDSYYLTLNAPFNPGVWFQNPSCAESEASYI